MGKKSYYELLKDPRWQRKRLELFKSNGWRCERCGSEEDSLHAHHGSYLKGFKPWEYPNKMYHCLCDNCHEFATSEMDHLNRLIGQFQIDNLEDLIFIALALLHKDNITRSEAALRFCNILNYDYEIMSKVADKTIEDKPKEQNKSQAKDG